VRPAAERPLQGFVRDRYPLLRMPILRGKQLIDPDHGLRS
jgi:hypothetical protein